MQVEVVDPQEIEKRKEIKKMQTERLREALHKKQEEKRVQMRSELEQL